MRSAGVDPHVVGSGITERECRGFGGVVCHANSAQRYSGYPWGFLDCQFHVSAHISSIPRLARQFSSRSARPASAYVTARSPGRREAMRYGMFWPVARSKAETISSTEVACPVPRSEERRGE